MLRLKHVLEENQKCVFTKVFTFYVPALAAGQEQGSCPAGEGEKRAGSGRMLLGTLLAPYSPSYVQFKNWYRQYKRGVLVERK